MKTRIFAFIFSFLCLFVCGCDLNNATESGDIYTDFSSVSTYSNIFSSVSSPSYINSSCQTFDNNDNEVVGHSSNYSSSSKTNSTSKNISTYTNASSYYKNSSQNKANESSKNLVSASSDSKIKFSTIKITNSNKKSFKTIGRCDTGSASGLALGWGGASIEFSLICEKEISLSFSLEDSLFPAYIQILLDDTTYYKRLEILSTTNITINTQTDIKQHSIKVIRLSDGEAAPLVLNSITTCGSLVEEPPINKPIYIEAIGSNNFCGCGLLLDSAGKYTESEINNPSNADSTLTYPYLASKKLTADCYLLAKSGAGFVATNVLQSQTINDTPQTICNPSSTFIQLYNQINIHNTKEYIPQRKPDILIIDAGILDSQLQLLKRVYYNGQLGISPKKSAIITAEFLNSLKSDNPNLKIVWCYGMTSTNENYISFINDVSGLIENGSDYFYTLLLPKAKNTNFPSAEEHNVAAKLLYQKLKNIMQ